MIRIVQKALFYLLLLCGTLLILVTMGSLFYDTSLWYLQILNFPRLGVLLALLVCLILYLIVRQTWSVYVVLFLTGLLVSIGIQASILFRYTILADKTVSSADAASVDKRAVFSIMVANVCMPPTGRQMPCSGLSATKIQPSC